MLRRTVLKSLSGLGFLAAVKPQIVDAARIIDNVVLIPDWCPKGFCPALGQKITPKQFPNMFDTMKLANGRQFYPIFWNKPYGILEVLPVQWLLGYEEVKISEDFSVEKILVGDMASVPLIAVEPFRWPNGSLAPPGFYSKVLVEKDKFETYYTAVKG